MYLSHFNLKIKPFRISPDPKFLWLGETHKEALAMLKYGIHDNRGFLLLSGDIGTGKTTLINGLLESLDDQTLIAMVSDPDLEKLDFYNFLTHAFDIKKTFKTKGDFLVHFIHFLHKSNEEGKKVLIIIDEAQRLRYEMLEEIRQLSNIEKKDTKLLNIFLVGQHELIDALNETRNRALLQRITMKYLIGPLKNEDVGEYIAFRLKIAGTEKKIFSSGAIRQVISFSNGYPRLINIICDHALLTAYVKGKKKVDGAMVKECAKDLHIKVEIPKGSQAGIRFFDRLFDAIRHPLQYPLLGILFYFGFLALFVISAVIIMFMSGLAPAWMPDKIEIRSFKLPAMVSKYVTPSEKSVSKPSAPAATPKPASNPSSVPAEGGVLTSSPSSSEAVSKPTLPFEEKMYIVQFPPDSNEFSTDGYVLLDRIIDIALNYTGLEIHVTGYTDSSGDVSYNKQLSRFRATVVKSYLVGNGVDTDKIAVSGMGPANPIAANDTPEGRQLNRRVEVLVRSKQ